MKSVLTADIHSPEGGQNLSRTTLGILAVGIFLLLLPMLSYPLGPDNGLFFVSGQKIVEQGAVHYRDIVDVKPPLIYYVNALAISLFGNTPLSIRILDLLVQLATCFILFRLIWKSTGSQRLGSLATILYALLYIGLNYSNTAQVESFVGILGLPAIWLFLFRRKPSGFFLIGLLCGVLTFFKFTLGIVLAGLLLGDLLLYSDDLRTRFRHYGALAAGFGTIGLLFALYLVTLDAAHGFANMQTFLSGYTGIQWSAKMEFIRSTLRRLPEFISDKYSLTMVFGTLVGTGAAVTGIGRSMPSHNEAKISEAAPNPGTVLLRICTILFVLLLCTVALEAKWLHYHISRLFPFGVILAACGIVAMYRTLAAQTAGRFRLFIIPVAIVFLLAFSPLTRYVFHLRPAFARLINGPEAFDAHYAHTLEDDTWRFDELREIGEMIRSKRQSGDKLYISSGVSGMLYLECNYIPDLAVFHSGFLIAPFAPEEWRDSTRTFLLREQPRFVVIQKSDRMPGITSVLTTSAELFKEKMPAVQQMLNTAYSIAMETPAFVVYEKKSEG